MSTPPTHAHVPPWFKRARPLAAVVGVAALVVGIAAGSAAQSTEKAAPAPTVTATRQLVVEQTVTATATPIVRKVIATRTRVRTVTYTPPPENVFSDGTYKVGEDIPAGEYRTLNPDGSDCYYEVDSDLGGNSIVTNDNFSGPARLAVNGGQYLKVDGGCEWQRA